MKLDLRIFHFVLLAVEAYPPNASLDGPLIPLDPPSADVDPATLQDHIRLAVEADLIDGVHTAPPGDPRKTTRRGQMWIPMRLTWKGHEYLREQRAKQGTLAFENDIAVQFECLPDAEGA